MHLSNFSFIELLDYYRTIKIFQKNDKMEISMLNTK